MVGQCQPLGGIHIHQPQFHIIVLFVDEAESVRRQLVRGKKARDLNAAGA